MKKKYIALILILIALALAGVLIAAAFRYENTRFFTLHKGEGVFERHGRILLNASEKTTLWLSADGEIAPSPLKTLGTGENGISAAVFDGKCFDYELDPSGLLYGAGTAETAVIRRADGLYRLRADSISPVFEGSAVWDENGVGVDAFSTDGGYAAGISGNVLSVIKLTALAPESSYSETLELNDPVIKGFLNGVHLWIEADGGLYVFDCAQKKIAKCPEAPFKGEAVSDLWQFSGFETNDGGAISGKLFNRVTGTQKTIKIPKDVKKAELADVSPTAARVLVKLDGRYALLKPDGDKAEFIPGDPQSVLFASDSSLVCCKDGKYELIRIVH